MFPFIFLDLRNFLLYFYWINFPCICNLSQFLLVTIVSEFYIYWVFWSCSIFFPSYIYIYKCTIVFLLSSISVTAFSSLFWSVDYAFSCDFYLHYSYISKILFSCFLASQILCSSFTLGFEIVFQIVQYFMYFGQIVI